MIGSLFEVCHISIPRPRLIGPQGRSGAHLWMGSESKGRSTEPWRQNPHTGFSTGSDGASTSSSMALGKLELVQKAFMSPFNHKKSDSTRILSDRTYIQPSNLVSK